MEVLKAALIYFLFSALLSLSAEGLRTAKRREAASEQQNKPLRMIEEKKEEPKMNKLQAEIAKLEAETDHSEVNELLLRMLYAKAEELGEDPSDEEAEEAVNQVKTDWLMQLLRRKRVQDAEDYDWDEDTRENMALIRSVFEDMNVRYREYVPQQGIYAFELGLTTDGKKLNMKVYLERILRSVGSMRYIPSRQNRNLSILCARSWWQRTIKDAMVRSSMTHPTMSFPTATASL